MPDIDTAAIAAVFGRELEAELEKRGITELTESDRAAAAAVIRDELAKADPEELALDLAKIQRSNERKKKAQEDAGYTEFAQESGLSDWLESMGLAEVEGRSGVRADDEISKLKAELRKIARQLEGKGVEEGSLRHKRLKKRYHELLERLRELAGGEADRFKTYPTEDFSEDDALFAEFAEQSRLEHWLQSRDLDTGHDVVDLTEEGQSGEAQETSPFKELGRPLIGAEAFLQISDEDDGELPVGKLREDAELHESLRAQAEQEHFGGDDLAGVSDDELWKRYREALGEDS